MFYLVLFLGLLSVAAGVFVVGFGIPIRESVFGSGLLLSGTVAITAGFIMVGLAAAVREMQRVGQALKARVPMAPRPLRPADRKEGGDKRPAPPRMAPVQAPRPPAEVPPPAAAPPEAPPQAPLEEAPRPERKSGPEWIKRALAELDDVAGPTDRVPPAPDEFQGIEAIRPAPEPRPAQNARAAQDAWLRPAAPPPPLPTPPPPESVPAPARPSAPPPNIFDMVWPSDRRRAPSESVPEGRHESAIEPPMRSTDHRSTELRPSDVRPAPAPPTPPLSIAPPPPRAEQRPVSILKSGVIDEMAYTLFTDGSIEAQMPDGTVRFASIDELRQHLERHEG